MLLVILDGVTEPGIRDLQRASFLLGQVRILKRGKNVIEFRFQFLKLCTLLSAICHLRRSKPTAKVISIENHQNPGCSLTNPIALSVAPVHTHRNR